MFSTFRGAVPGAYVFLVAAGDPGCHSGQRFLRCLRHELRIRESMVKLTGWRWFAFIASLYYMAGFGTVLTVLEAAGTMSWHALYSSFFTVQHASYSTELPGDAHECSG